MLTHHYQRLNLTLNVNDFTDSEAIAAVTRATAGNFRLLQRLFSQIRRLMEINGEKLITAELVEAARESLVIGSP